MNTLEYLFSLFAFLAFVLAILFFLKKKGDKIANRLLGIYVLLFGYNIFYNILFWTGKLFTADYIAIIFTNMLVWVLYGPILFFYIRRVIYESRFKWSDLVHFLPFLIIALNYSKVYLTVPEEKVELVRSGKVVEVIYYFNRHQTKVIIALMILYFGIIMFHLRSKTVGLNKRIWLKWMSFSFLGYVLSFSSYFLLTAFGPLKNEQDYIIGGSMVFFISILTYFGFLQPEIFDGVPLKDIVSGIKYKTSGLSEDFSTELKEKLERFMKENKPYLNSEFRLDDLADKLNISRHHCSQVINEHFGSNFFNYINSYRVEEAKNLLKTDTSLNISEVIYASGFNNRMSFYKAFKRFTGTTPKLFLDSLHP